MSQQIQLTGGAKVRDLQDVIIGTSGVLSSLAFNVANGVPKLDVNGKILVSQLPNSVMEYKGTWNAATNTPTLADGTGNQGDVYLCNVAGTVDFGAGPIAFVVGDQVIYSGSIWQRASGATGTVTSVAITESGDSLNITGSPITTSGTINIGFNGTNLQYVNGAGNLTTFPTLTGYVPYTGATANVDLGVYDLTADLITGARGSFASNGGSDTFAINHSSGGGIALNITKGGSGEGLYINKTSGSGNAATIIGGVTLLDELHLNTDLADAYIASATNWNTAYSLRISSATLPLSITSNVISISQATTSTNGYLSSTDWNTFNGKESALTFSYPLSRVGNTISIPIATASTDGYLTDTDWFIFNSKQAALSGTGFVKISGTTISYDNSTYYLASNPSAFIALTALSSSATGLTYTNTTGVFSLTAGYSIPTTANQTNWTTAYNDSIISAAVTGTTTKTLTLNQQDGGTITASWTDINTDAVTSVFGRTGAVVAVSGDYTTAQVTEVTNLYYTDTRARLALSFAAGSGAYNSTTGVITIPTNNNQITNGAGYITGNQTITLSGDVSGSGTTAITTTIGALKVTNAMLAGSIDLTTKVTGLLPDGNISSAATWNAKQNAITLTTTGTSGAATLVGATLNIPQYTDAYTGTVTSVAALTIGTTGTDLSSSVANSTTTPVITLNVPTASATNRGVLASADWTTFNSKQGTITLTTTGTSGAATFSANTLNIPQYQGVLTNPVTGTGTTNYLPKFTGTSTIGNSSISDNGTGRVSIGTTSFNDSFVISNSGTTGWEFGNSGSVITYNRSTAAYIPMTFEASNYILNRGNLGLGVTPSASWIGDVKAIQIGNAGSQISASNEAYSGGNNLWLSNNSYQNSSVQDIYMRSASAGMYWINGNIHKWFNAPSGTAGAAITFTQAMTLTAAGNLGLGTTSPSTALSGTNLTINSNTSYSSLIIKYNNTDAGFVTSEGSKFIIGSLSSLPLQFNTGGLSRMYITDGGNVLIGTTTDSGYKLDVNGGADLLKLTRTSVRSYGFQISSGGTFTLYDISAGADRLTIASTGAATFTGNVTAPNLYAGSGTGAPSVQVFGGASSNSIGGSAYITLQDVTNTRFWGLQADASQKLNFWHYNGGWTSVANISSTGAATFSSSVQANGNFVLATAGTRIAFDNNLRYILPVTSGDKLRISQNSFANGIEVGFDNGTTFSPSLSIASTGAATFSSSVTAASAIINNGVNSTDGIKVISSTTASVMTGGIEFMRTTVTGGSKIEPLRDAAIGGVGLNFLVTANNTAEGNATYTSVLQILNTGAATFSSSVTAGGLLSVNGDATLVANFNYASNGTYARWQNNGTSFGDIGSAGSLVSGGSTNDFAIHARSTYNMVFATNFTERMRITSGGDLYVKGNGSDITLSTRIYSDDTYSDFLASATSATAKTMRFFAKNTLETMRITSGGQVSIGPSGTVYGTNLLNVNGGIYATSSIAAVVAADIDMLAFVNTGATYSKACVVASMTATGGTGSYFFYGQQSTSTAAIKIFSNGNIQNTNNSYGAISDARLKENIKDATPKLDDLMKVKVRNYNLKGESNKQLGVISQELEAIFPNMIEESTNMGENMKIKGVKYSVFVPMLIKAVQEQQQQINELKQLINK